jgi:hypothetical protein
MKTIYFLLMLIASNPIFSQITYVDNFDGVYPMSSSSTFNFDLNNDGQNDLRLWRYAGVNSINCNGVGSSAKWGTFRGIANSFGLNLVNGNGNGTLGIDCANDTLNILDTWSEYSELYKVTQFPNGVCDMIGFGTHKQGFRIIMTNPANGALGYKYGYVDYTLASTGDIIIHGWYYENTFNVPIVANSQLDYPYDGNCIQYDTVTVYDTITTTIYDTITTQVFDTVLVSVTDTLLIETTLSLSPLTQNTISVFPNPTNDHVTIHTGNFALMPNYSIKIENSLGQLVFTTPLNQQTFYLDLNGWSGNGIYYLKLLDAQSNEVTVRKIVLQ